eukprot:CAMPEP_0181319190 /NCGR_PEP_ID=MMETSP1101-20121128/17432_1 /TAXON_ID=46948 /ORGANISM="Rhodomonas abbreviata, Strain Caron Lab Isolate" /LENGTH=145 /DNA_ID=CAMNT_0023426759 /DNA_START=271 /DNA_END=708 /DNA_ORIENTATION=-
MDGAQVGVLEQGSKVCLGGLLEGHDGVGLEAEVRLEVLGNLPHQTLERKLSDEELGRLLVPSDLTEGYGSRPEAMGLLHATGGWRRLAGGLGGELLARSLKKHRTRKISKFQMIVSKETQNDPRKIEFESLIRTRAIDKTRGSHE